MINRFELVNRHNPKLNQIDYESPLSVGNGELACTVDITGMQTLYQSYEEHYFPLCTMSQWGWHTTPVNKTRFEYTLADIEMTKYQHSSREVVYAVEEKQGNEHVYKWLRENPHRLNLARIGLYWKGEKINAEDITQINQTLHLYEGCIESHFRVHDIPCKVLTVCGDQDVLGFSIVSEALITRELSVKIEFPYGDPSISGSNWQAQERHLTRMRLDSSDEPLKVARIDRQLDKERYTVKLTTTGDVAKQEENLHVIEVFSYSNVLELSVLFLPKHIGGIEEETEDKSDKKNITYKQVLSESQERWRNFWLKGGAIEFIHSKDTRANELERRVVLSQYLMGIQTTGTLPPQETGLTCNSWYGKFHLEMHIWHGAWLTLWGKGKALEKSLSWYRQILPEAIANAKRNGYKGARWPKMVAYSGIDSPSWIATLLIWQQPHLIYMLEMLYASNKSRSFLEENWDLIKATADFMCDFVSYNPKREQYDLIAPIIPAQEEHQPMDVINPTFEVAYWRFTLIIASRWAKRMGFKEEQWDEVASKMAVLPVGECKYLAHENCPTTFENYAKDHPSMLGALGFIKSDRVNSVIMEATLEKVLTCWDFDSMWGWDFAMIAMTCLRLNKPELALDILLMDKPKNTYVTSGNNYQKLRKDLPLYLPGNGSLLMVVAMMARENCFTKMDNWEVVYEQLETLPQIFDN